MLLVSNGNTTAVVDRLEHDGLVTRTPSAADRRVVHVALTDAGRRHFEQLAVDHEAQVDSLFSGVSDRRPRRARRTPATNDRATTAKGGTT